MNFDKEIPSSVLNRMISAQIPPSTQITLSYKRTLKDSIGLFTHLLLTYAQEISAEEHTQLINTRILKKALEELNFHNIMDKLEELENNKNQTKLRKIPSTNKINENKKNKISFPN